MALQKQTSNTEALTFQAVNEVALNKLEDILDALGLLADGKKVGKEFQMLNPKRNDGELGSFSINTETGAWADFATADKGGDVISLVAYITNQTQGKAKDWLVGQLGLTNTVDTPSTEIMVRTGLPVDIKQSALAPAVKDKPIDSSGEVCVMPIPEDLAQKYLNLGSDHTGNLGLRNGVDVVSIKSYPYRNITGQINSFMLRRNLANGDKEIRPRSCWKKNSGRPTIEKRAPSQPYTLYNLDQLASRPEAPVLVTEGEKSADAASKLFPDHVVTTTMFGAQSPLNSDLMPLVGRNVTFWPDNDNAGVGYVDKIADFLHKQDSSMKMHILTPPRFKAVKDAEGQSMLESMPEELPPGWDAADALADGWTADHILLLPSTQFAQYVVPELDQNREFKQNGPDTYLYNYSISDGHLCIGKRDKKTGEVILTKVSSALIVVAKTRDENNQNWGALVRFYDPDNRLHEFAIPSELLCNGQGESFVKGLLSHGLIVYVEKLLKEYLMRTDPPARALCVKQIGWHGNVFVLPESTFGTSGERVILQSTDITRQSAYVVKGSLEEWKKEVASLCSGNSRLILALSVALAGPLLKPMSIENGGFHFRGASSTGKSKTLFTAASVWGSRQMIKLWRTTDNAVESLAYSHNDTLLCLDELGQVDPNKAGDIAYTLANGLSKARSTQSGNIRTITHWRVLFLSTGEISLADHIATTGGHAKAGQEIRMLDIPADAQQGMGVFENIHGAKSPAEFADLLQANADKFHGTAGQAFLDHLTRPGEMQYAIEFIKQKMIAFMQIHVPISGHGQIQRGGNRFAFVAAVGEYCISLGILPFAAGEAMTAVGTCFNAWLHERGGDQAMEEFRAEQQVRAYIQRNGESRFTFLDESELSEAMGQNYSQRTNLRVGFKNILPGGLIEYWVFTEMYKEEICKGLDAKLVTRVLKQKGYLGVDSKGNPQIAKRIPGVGQTTRMYIIKPSILQDMEEQPKAA